MTEPTGPDAANDQSAVVASATPTLVAALALLLLSLGFAAGQGDFDRASPDEPRSVAAAGESVPATAATAPATTQPPDTAPISTVAPTVPVASVDELEPQDIETFLADAGFPGVSVAIDGQNLTVTGSVPDDATRRALLAQAASIPNVAEVIDELTLG